jgi:hypothetical protein
MLTEVYPERYSATTPESLGLKHLAFRPKKQQLIEDQRQQVAKENAKLMSGMTKVCSVVQPCLIVVRWITT